MRVVLFFLTAILCAGTVLAQAALPPAQDTPPTLDEVRRQMGIPSLGQNMRGQRDTVGFAFASKQMEAVWELSATPPAPEKLGDAPGPGVAGVICPHDDYMYAGRVYRSVLPLVTAKTVVVVGVFHRYRKFGAHDVLVFDPYRTWRAPDGEIRVSSLRREVLAALPAGDWVQDYAMHDSEHSLEAVTNWLRHLDPDVEILPIIVPSASFERFETLADHLATALAAAMGKRGWVLGRDVSVVISSDAVHYGADFGYTPYGEGGIDAYVRACEKDREVLRGPLAGPLTTDKIRSFYETCVNPGDPDEYRLTWCGRFAIPMGLLLIDRLAERTGAGTAVGHPVAYGTSVGGPELPLRPLGLGTTAPSNLYHFVGQPGVAITVAPQS